MYPIKRLRPMVAISGLILFSAICAMAQAEVDPDHFDRAPQPTLAIQKAHIQQGMPAAVHGSNPAVQLERQDTAGCHWYSVSPSWKKCWRKRERYKAVRKDSSDLEEASGNGFGGSSS